MLVVVKESGGQLVINYGSERLLIENLTRATIKLGIIAPKRFQVERRRAKKQSGFGKTMDRY